MKTKLVIFGITGDLSRRKLLPALAAVDASGVCDELEFYGVSRRAVDLDDLLSEQPALRSKTQIITMDIAKAEDYSRLKNQLSVQPDEQVIIYLSVPPLAATQIVDFLGAAKLNGPNVKVLFEKPFGVDHESAHEVIERTGRYFDEDQVYRIDHYLAKEMAQSIVAFRGGNALFANIWCREFIERIEVVASEAIDIEGRVEFYEQTGALRDVVQGHLMQLLALVLMDIPDGFDWQQLPDLRREALARVESADPSLAVRAQYDEYRQETGIHGSRAETFARIELESGDDKWKGVPIVLVAGKALAEKSTEIRVYLRKQREAQSNSIVFRVQPDEGIDIELFVKRPGYDRQFEARHLSFHYPDDVALPDAYEQVLVDAIRSHKSLFTSGDEVLEAWRILAPLQHAWDLDEQSLVSYKKGMSWQEVSDGA